MQIMHANFTNMLFNAKLFEMMHRISDVLTHFIKMVFCIILPGSSDCECHLWFSQAL